MKKAICFARVSTVQQSLEAQLEAVKKCAISDGYTDDEILVVTGKESAIKLDEEQRQTLAEIKEMVKTNPTIESIYFFAVDRLARRMSIVMSVKEWADENKLNLVFLNPHRMGTIRVDENGNKVEDEVTTLLLAMLSYGAAMEMKVKKARFETAKKAMKMQGKLPQGKPIKGYYLDADRTILVNPTEAETIYSIFNDYLNGNNESLNSIHEKYVLKGFFEPLESKYLNAGKTRVWNMLKDCSYCGRTKTIKKKYKGGYTETNITYPAIITEEMYDAVQEKLASRKQQPKKTTKNIYFAKGLIKCGECGASMKTDTFNCTYTCKEKKGHTLSLNMNVADNLTWLEAKSLWNWYTLLDWNTTQNEYKEAIVNTERKIEIINAQIEEQYKAIDRIEERYALGKVRKEVADKINNEATEIITRHKIELVKLEASLINYKKLLGEIEAEAVHNPKEFDAFSDEEKVKVISKVIEKVIVYRTDDYSYLIHFIPTERIKMFAELHKGYWEYDSKRQNLYRWSYYENGHVNGVEVHEEYVKSGLMNFHLEEKRHPQRQRRNKKGNAN